MSTAPSRGARVRRGGHGPGWGLLTALLMLAIAASSALVFTNRVELLKLAVIVALWAAVAAAFGSVIYRRQSDVDQARARDLKFVYDLQLDREISARREYELTVESQLRRELASELRDQAADEVAALRAELSALRTNLEILFDADLGNRPALETERGTVRTYSDRAYEGDEVGGGVRVSAASIPVHPYDTASQTAENPIIDVPEVGVPVAAGAAPATWQPTGDHRGSHRRDDDDWPSPDSDWPPPGQHRRDSVPDWGAGVEPRPPQPYSQPQPQHQPQPQPQPWSQPWSQPQPQPRSPTPAAPTSAWQPVAAEGEWLPPGVPGSNWTPDTSGATAGSHGTRPDQRPFDVDGAHGAGGAHGAPAESATPPRHSRHARPADPVTTPPYAGGRRQTHARHSPEPVSHPAGPPPSPTFAEPYGMPAPVARHRSSDHQPDTGPPVGAESAADLLARLQAGPAAGGGRRRRAE